jgi:hypothetical protein
MYASGWLHSLLSILLLVSNLTSPLPMSCAGLVLAVFLCEAAHTRTISLLVRNFGSVRSPCEWQADA